MTRAYVCSNCGGAFTTERSNEEAIKEMKDSFGQDVETRDCAAVCEECYGMFLSWFNKLSGKERAAIEGRTLN